MDYRHFIMCLMSILPVDKKKIVFSSYYGRTCNDCPRKISDILHEIAPDLKQVWVLENHVEHPTYVRCVKPGGLKSVFEFVTSKVWIDNCRKPSWFVKKKEQYYIQTWHGGVCLKYVENDAADTLSKEYLNNAKNDSKMADFFISECDWRTQNYRSAFGYEGEILRCGINRMAIDPDINYHDKVCKELGISADTQLVLYAPTFRNDGGLDCYNIDYDVLKNALEKKFGANYTIIIRLHPNIAKLNSRIEYSDNIINGTNYTSVEELITASEILITDYSGCMFDGFRVGKKVIIYASDIEEYSKNERGFYFDLKELPSPIATNNDELIALIKSFDIQQYETKRNAFVKKLGYYEDGDFNSVAKLIVDITK